MKLRCLIYSTLGLLLANSQARAQKWFTSEVAKEIGRVPCSNCKLGRGDEKPVLLGPGRVTAVKMAAFDTIATYVQGRIVDAATGKPIKGAFIQTSYKCWNGCDVKAAATNAAGFFRLGWVGCHGPKGTRTNRPLLIQAVGYQSIRTEAVAFSGDAYLHVELAAGQKMQR